MDRVSNLLAHYFTDSAGELRFGTVPVSELAAAYGTPMFVYQKELLEQKWNRLRQALPPDFHIAYSVKANPNRTIIEFFLQKQALLEIASAGEFHQAMAAGCKPEQMIFAGPGKSAAELELVVRHGIGEIHAESRTEIERIESICDALKLRARVALRVNPSGEAEGGAMRMGGRSAPFGIDEEHLDAVLDHLGTCRNLEFTGIHLFSGTQILDAGTLLVQYRKGIEIACRVADHIRRPIETIDFGGGLGIPYFAHEEELDTDRLSAGLVELVNQVRQDSRLAATKLVVEPGRYLVGEAGVYVCQVSDIKDSRGKRYLIVDGGMHHHLAASGNLGQTIKRNYPLAILNRLQEEARETVDVVGPLCTPLDVLARAVSLPPAKIGDFIGVFQSGAYGRSASPLGFLSHLSPPEVWVENGQHSLIRHRGSYQDFMRDLCAPASPPLATQGHSK